MLENLRIIKTKGADVKLVWWNPLTYIFLLFFIPFVIYLFWLEYRVRCNIKKQS